LTYCDRIEGTQMILVCGGLADPITRFLCDRLKEYGAAYRFVDQRIFPCGYAMSCRWRHDELTGWIAAPDWCVDFEEITGVYVRYLSAALRESRNLDRPTIGQALHTENDFALESVFAGLPCPIVNRFAGGSSNESKPYQALLIRRSRLRIPPTLVTTDRSAACQFYDKFEGRVIYKSVSGRSIGTRVLTRNRLPRLFHNSRVPLQLQEFIPGVNIRVHVVGNQVIATQILSEAVDYRFAKREGWPIQMEAAFVPEAVAEDCIRLTEECGLLFSGIDLKKTAAGDFYCFEINPSPGFSFFECVTKQRISLALTRLLKSKSQIKVATNIDSRSPLI
jgi:glutathione synthase/RimK-type ligase-like ATP-grasp enzyme